jgi:DNA-binding NtrC family response regulator
MLLSFVESGRTEPEFRNKNMNQAALGPLRVLCIFTAQLRHIEQRRIIEDIDRRIRRGLVINIPPLHERPEEIVPIFYEKLKNYRRNQDASWQEPDDINDLIPPASQSFLGLLIVEVKAEAELGRGAF